MITKKRDRVLSILRRLIQSKTLKEWIRAVKLSVAKNYRCRIYNDESIIKAIQELSEKTRRKAPKPFSVFYFVLYDSTFNSYYLVAAIYKVLYTATTWTTIVEEANTVEQLSALLSNPNEQDNIVEDIISEINKFNVTLNT